MTVLKELETRQSAREEEPRHREAAAPAVERRRRRRRADESDPGEGVEIVRADEQEQALEEVHAGVIAHRLTGDFRVFGPPARAVGEVARELHVQAEVAEVVGRADLESGRRCSRRGKRIRAGRTAANAANTSHAHGESGRRGPAGGWRAGGGCERTRRCPASDANDERDDGRVAVEARVGRQDEQERRQYG